MKAAVYRRYGPPEVVEIEDVPRPEPGQGEIRVRVLWTTVNRTDCGNRKAHPFFIRPMTGLFRPKQPVLGLDFAGTVDCLGAGVTRFEQGDRVFGMSPESYGAHAEYLCIGADAEIEPMPAGVRPEDAVICEGAWYANSTVGRTKPGDRLLIYGASGAIGTAAVLLAKANGAHVTAVVATGHLELARSLGADRVIDYTAEDFTAIGETFDIVFDAVGKTSYFRCRRLLKPGAVYCATDLGPWWSNLLLPLFFTVTFQKPRVILPMPGDAKVFVRLASELLKTGKLRGIFDRDFALGDIVEAYSYVETEQKTGIVRLKI